MTEISTTTGDYVPSSLLKNYFKNLVNQFFKILPMKENGEDTLIFYMESLQKELIGCKDLIPCMKEDPMYLILLSILQYLIDHQDMSVLSVRREVFRAISVCNKLRSEYEGKENTK